MKQLTIILDAVLPVFIVIGTGLVLRRTEILLPEADSSLIRLTINLFIPCLIAASLLGNEALRNVSNVFLPPFFGFVTVSIGIVLGLVVSCRLRLSHPKGPGTFAFCVGLYNYGYIPIPLVMSLFDRQTLGVLFVHNLGVEAAFWAFATILIAGQGLRDGLRKLLNAPLLTIISMLIINAVGLYEYVPESLINAANMIGQCAVPVGMLLIGATIADQLQGVTFQTNWWVITAALLLRIIVLPAIFIFLALVLPLSAELRRVMIVQAAMPAAVFPIVVTRHYHGDISTALWVVISTSVVGLVSIPLWLKIGLSLLN